MVYSLVCLLSPKDAISVSPSSHFQCCYHQQQVGDSAIEDADEDNYSIPLSSGGI